MAAGGFVPTGGNFSYAPDPDNPGWLVWAPHDDTRYNSVLGRTIVRAEGERIARVRMWPAHRHTNSLDAVHGGVLLMLADVGLVAGARVLGAVEHGVVTLDLQMQFVTAGRPDDAMDLVVELVRETGRLMFARGTIKQAGQIVATTAGTFRKHVPRG